MCASKISQFGEDASLQNLDFFGGQVVSGGFLIISKIIERLIARD